MCKTRVLLTCYVWKGCRRVLNSMYSIAQVRIHFHLCGRAWYHNATKIYPIMCSHGLHFLIVWTYTSCVIIMYHTYNTSGKVTKFTHVDAHA